MEQSTFPKELVALPNWVCWRPEQDHKNNRVTKVPYTPSTGRRASSSNPETWETLEQALYGKEKYMFPGVGFMFTAESGIVGVDIDHCLDENGKPNQTASAILKRLPPTYIEISPSGTGLHIFLRGALPPGGNKNSQSGVEMYGSRRYFTMTGNRYASCVDSVAAGDEILKWIHDSFIRKQGVKSKRSSQNQGISTLPDEKLLEAARSAKGGDLFDELWRGEWQERYKSQSEADFALCCKLAFWANRDAGKIDRLFRQSGLFREKWDARHHGNGETYGETTVRRACDATPETYAPQRKRPVSIFEQDGAYFRKRGDNVSLLTNFTVRPTEMIVAEDEAQLTCDFVTENGEAFRQNLLSDDFSNLQKFKKVLNRRTIALCFFGTEGDLEAFKGFVQNLDWKKKKGVKALGIYRHNQRFVFVSTEKAVAAGGEAVNTIVQLEKYRSLDSAILAAPFLTKAQLLELGESLLRYNEPAKTVPILAWAAGCFIKPHLKHGGVKYPHLFLIGEAGSGKSNTLERVILPVFSRSKVSAASQMTAFTLMRESCSSNVIPQALDEFKPSKLDKNRLHSLYNHFRDSYDFHEGMRGRSDQTAVTYDLLAPIIVAGEESADESAIRERTVELLFSKRDLKNMEYVETFGWLSRNGNLLSAFGRTLMDTALRTTVKETMAWYAEGLSRFEGGFPTRIACNLACVSAGLKLVEKLCGAFSLTFDVVFPLEPDACRNNIEYAAREYLLDGGAHNKSVVEQTFEVMARMNLKPDRDFLFEAAGRRLCLCLSGVYDRYTRYRRDYAIVGEVLPYAQFRKQLEHSEYFVEKNKVRRFGDVTQRVWIVDFEKLQQACDVSGFLKADAAAD